METRLKEKTETEVQSIYKYVDNEVGQAKENAQKATAALEAKHNKRLVALEEAFDLLMVGNERALRHANGNVVILQNFAPAEDGDTEAKEHITNVCQARSKGEKPKKVEHVKDGHELTQYTRVIFEILATVQHFISKWI